MIFAVWTAFLIDCLIGDPYWFPHPVRLMGAYIHFFEEKVRVWAKTSAELKWAGFFLVATLCAITFFSVFFLLRILYRQSFYLGLGIEIFLLWTCIAYRCLYREVRKIGVSLKNGKVETARKQVSYLVSRDTEGLDEKGIVKAAAETALENISDGIIAPIFYMFIGGAPLAMLYKAINTMDSMVGYKNEKYMFFGFYAAKLDDAANYIPARLTGLLMVFWAFLSGKDYKNGWRIMLRDAGKSKSPNAGWPEAAGAGVMGIALCGPTSYFGEMVEKEVIGEEREEIQAGHVMKTCSMMTAVTVLALVFGSLCRLLLLL